MSTKMLLHKYLGPDAAGGHANFFEPGTSTAKSTYTSTDYSTAEETDVPISSDGWIKTYLLGDYDMDVFDKNGTQLPSASADGINPQEASVANNPNLVPNGSFETDSDGDGTPDSWVLTSYAGSTNERISSDQRHGAHAMSFTSAGNGGGHLTTSDFIAVNIDVPVYIGFAIKSTVADVRNVVDILWFTEAEVAVSTTSVYDEDTGNPTSWDFKSFHATPPATAAYAKIRLYGCHSSDNTSGTTIYDDVQLLYSIGQLDVDNLRLDGNTISSTDTNGDINLTPDGTGSVKTSILSTLDAYTAGGSADAQTVTMDPVLAAYSSKVRIAFIPVADNTGACTLNVNGLGAQDIKMIDGTDPPAGALNASGVSVVQHNGNSFILLNPDTLLSSDNFVRNGSFRVDQYANRAGLTFSTYTATSQIVNNDDTYIFDLWKLLSDGNDVVDISASHEQGVYGQIEFDVETANKKFGVAHYFHSFDTSLLKRGGVCALSFTAKIGASNTTVDKVRAAVLSWDGTADAITSDVVSAWNAEGANPTLVANWSYLNTPADITLTSSHQRVKIENISLSASANNLALFVWLDNDDGTVTDKLYLADVKLEPGKNSTPFVPRNHDKEKELVDNFLQIFDFNMLNNTFTGWAQISSATNVNLIMPLRTPLWDFGTSAAVGTWTNNATNRWFAYDPAGGSFAFGSASIDCTHHMLTQWTATISGGTTSTPSVWRLADNTGTDTDHIIVDARL